MAAGSIGDSIVGRECGFCGCWVVGFGRTTDWGVAGVVGSSCGCWVDTDHQGVARDGTRHLLRFPFRLSIVIPQGFGLRPTAPMRRVVVIIDVVH